MSISLSSCSPRNKVPDFEVLKIKQQNQLQKVQQTLTLPINERAQSRNSPLSTERTDYAANQTLGSESERVRLCGSLFDRRATMNPEMLDEFFRREPCPYGKRIPLAVFIT